MKKNYSFVKTVIVRTPVEEKNIDLTWEKIQEVFSKKENREALFLGSYNVYNALLEWENGEKFQNEADLKNLKGALYKYASRLSNRSTPFGMFATVATIVLSSMTNVTIKKDRLGRVTKYDMHFLGTLIPKLIKNTSIRNALKYFSNNSMYRVFDKFRYVEYYSKDNVRFHKISEVHFTKFLDLVFEKSKDGIFIDELVDLLICDDISRQDALAFIDTLIESQFIVSELEFTLTGEDYLDKVIHIFSEKRFSFYDGQVIRKKIIELKTKINELDRNCINDPSLYCEIHKLIRDQIDNVDITKLFQVDTYRDIESGSLGFKTLKTLRQAISALNRLSSAQENSNLKEFIKKFQERYEEYEQPLIEVLDPDIGIGYGKKLGAKAPLVEELVIVSEYDSVKQINLDVKKRFLLKKLIYATANNLKKIDLTDEEINQFNEDEGLYPDTFSVFINVFNENGKEKINLKSVSGPTANALIGRFAHLDERILNLCNEISDIENKLNPDTIVAEIVHLPENRTGNILYRKFKRNYEIPYLGISSLPKENQIPIEDLYISIKRGKIFLRSKKLGKQVIPRLSNAHNFSSNALPIYHFLCDIQNQYSMGFGFSWGALQNDFSFLPRLTYKDAVLSRATWNIADKEINTAVLNDDIEVIQEVRKLQKGREIPNLIYITDEDNEVLINFENELSCMVFYSILKGKKNIQLKEFLFKEDTITNKFCNELVISAHRNIEKIEGEPTTKVIVQKQNIKESFSIGEEWLYFKFYCGERAGEEFLNASINPIVNQLKEKGLIEKWFFIRYYDALGHHIRFRILLKDLSCFTESMITIKDIIKPFEENKIVWKTQTDTYLRELQRYGCEVIESTESLFYNDSETTLKFIGMIVGDSGEKVRWLFALLSIDHLLNDFGISLRNKVEILNLAKTSFGKEFNRSGKLNKQINESFAKHEDEIVRFLDANNIDKVYAPLWGILQERTFANGEVVTIVKNLERQNRLPDSLNTLMLSYIHMVCNRLFLTKHRMHEMVVYDYLYKYYAKKFHSNRTLDNVNKKQELISE